MKRHVVAGAVSIAFVAACGGTVVFEEPGSGGDDSSRSSAAPSSGSNATSATGAATPCTDTTDCAGGEVCVLDDGECRPGCIPGDCAACGPGLVCEPCATSSCPGCKDCISACIPVTAQRCDDDDPCPDGQACLYAQGTCHEQCSEEQGDFCENGACSSCQTGSCCGCRDCVDLCVPI
jgi:hypothetical protein